MLPNRDLIDRLRCQYAIGPIVNGVPEFGYRDYSGASITTKLPTRLMLEAADEIERLNLEMQQLHNQLENYLRTQENDKEQSLHPTASQHVRSQFGPLDSKGKHDGRAKVRRVRSGAAASGESTTHSATDSKDEGSNGEVHEG